MPKRIAGYEILEALGKGSFGESFKARQISLDRLVHLTVLPPPETTKGIHSVARVCASLTHPHLVSGIDLGEAEGVRFLVTEWVEGPSVGEVVRRGGSIAEERSLEIALACAQGLDQAARHGLVHGGITPEAVVIALGGNPKLRGFGADRALARSAMDWRSPEQRRGLATDVRSDIWSLGAVLYFMLSAQHPAEGAPPPEVADGVVIETTLPLREANRKLQPETYDLVERMLAQSAEARFPSARELTEALEALLVKLDERVSLRPAAVRRARPAHVRRFRRHR